MEPWWLRYLSVPCCGSIPILKDEPETLACEACDVTYPIEDGVIRFGRSSDYASSFGVEWSQFSETQIDHRNGTTISTDRLREIAGGSLQLFRGVVAYDSGCGSGRFSAVAVQHGARVIAADLSLAAVRACRRNTRDLEDVVCIHAAAERLPVQERSIDVVLSIGVYQHTPDPIVHVRHVASVVRPGGRFVFWGYERRLKSLAHPKYALRPFTRRLDPAKLLGLVRRTSPALLRLSDMARKLPGGLYLSRLVPVANYAGLLPLDEQQRLEWAVLDTFDWLSPRYDRPATYAQVSGELERGGFRVKRTLDDSIGLVGAFADDADGVGT